MKKISIKLILATFLATFLLFSCSSDDSPTDIPNTDALPKDETWVIFNGAANWSGGIYALGDNKSREINLADLPFYQLQFSAGGKIANNTLFKKDGALSTDFGVSKFKLEGNKVVADGFLSTPNNTYETNYLVVSSTEGYYWNLAEGGLKIHKFNPTTMKRTGEIDFSSLSDGSQYEAAGQLILAKRDNKLYVDVQNGTRTAADWQVAPKEEKVKIAVYNLDTNKIENTTEYAGATNLGLFADHVLWSIDEVSKDLYVIAIGNMKTQKPKSRILRIKSNETKFDTNFELNIGDYQYPSDFNRIFAHNNKIYTTISSRPTSYYGGGQHGVTYRADIWYWTEIDVNTKKATRLNLPVDSFYSFQNPFYHKEEIYFVSNNKIDGYAGVNQYNPKTGKIKETFRLKESGRLMGFHILDKK